MAFYVKQVERLGMHSIVGDVWSAHLPYVEGYIAANPAVSIVVVERDRAAVISNFDKKTSPRETKRGNFNYWVKFVNGRSDF